MPWQASRNLCNCWATSQRIGFHTRSRHEVPTLSCCSVTSDQARYGFIQTHSGDPKLAPTGCGYSKSTCWAAAAKRCLLASCRSGALEE